MPSNTLAAQLLAALADQDVSIAELARRIATAEGASANGKRRWLQKVLSGQVKRPNRRSLTAIEHALGKPAGFFTVPPRSAQNPEAELLARLESVEATVAALHAVLDLVQGAQDEAAPLLAEIAVRLSALERRAAGESSRG